MQKIIYIDGKYTNEVDMKLSEGWKVISVNPVSSHTEHTYHFGAYVVLEKSENQTTITPKISESQKVDINVNVKNSANDFPHYSYSD